MSSTNPSGDTARLVPNIPPPTVSVVSPTIGCSMIDSRNVYKISPAKSSVLSPQQPQQDIVKIRLTKDDSGTGFGYTKSIISTVQSPQGNRSNTTLSQPNSSLFVLDKDKHLTLNKRETIETYFVRKPPPSAGRPGYETMQKNAKKSNFVSDKSDSKSTPQKLNFNLAQQPTLQLKTSQNKIVLVKMLPKIPQNGPQMLASPPTSRSSVSPTTLALARSVQGLRPLPPVGSPTKPTATTQLVMTRSPEKKESVASRVISRSESTPSLSPSHTVTAAAPTINTSSSIEGTKSSNLFANNSAPTEKVPDDQILPKCDNVQKAIPTVDNQNNDECDNATATVNVKMSREMKCLKASQDSSKILTEFMQDSKSEKLRKRRRSRYDGDDSQSCGSLTPTSMKRYSVCGRDDEDLDDGSPSSGLKRTGMRSANAEFSLKQRKFLSSIHHTSDGSDNSDHELDPASTGKSVNLHIPVAPKPGWDKFCWRCKTCEPGLETCAGCIRCFHPVCLKLNPAFFIVEKKWNCPECIKLQSSDESGSDEGGKPVKDKLKIDSLTVSLKFAMKRMQLLKGSMIFNPLDNEQFPNYAQYVTKHVDLAMLQKNVDDQKYQSTDAFQADIGWILHNASIYPNNSKLLPIAKALMKICKQELNEIEACNECYFNANTCKTWFTEVCTKPHLLVWAKLKGFPFWPAKLMSVNSNQLVDVRFFGDHDRAWVPIKECYLFCEKDPNTKLQRRTNMAECMREAEQYIAKLKRKFGQFKYAEFRTPVEANRLDEHLESMIPGVLKRIAESGDSQKAKLMLRIIKTADNFLSVSPVEISAPTKTSTPKVARSDSIASPEKSKSEVFDNVDVKTSEETEIHLPHDTSKDETNISDINPEYETRAIRQYSTRKRKSVSPEEDATVSQEISKEAKKRHSRNTICNVKEEGESVTTDLPKTSTQRSHFSRKRKSVSPLGDIMKEQKQSKVESVVIQRESDSWKTVQPAKKHKSKSKSFDGKGDMKESDCSETSDTQSMSLDFETKLSSKNDKQKDAVPAAPETQTPINDKPCSVIGVPPTIPKNSSIPLIPLTANEIKTEPTEEEQPPDSIHPIVTAVPVPPPQVAAPSSETSEVTSNVSDNAASIVSQELLPIKAEPLSDEENERMVVANKAPSISEVHNKRAVSTNQVMIRTNNRIMVKDINKLTHQVGNQTVSNIPGSNGQTPVIVTPAEKPKNLSKTPAKHANPNIPPQQQQQQQQQHQQHQQQQQQQRTRKITAQPVNQSTFTSLMRTPNQPSGMPVSIANSFPVAKNGSNMMHMVHIPSPLLASGEQPTTVNPVALTRANLNDTTVPIANVATRSTVQQQAAGPSTVPLQQNVTPTAGTSANSPAATNVAEGQHMMSGFITPNLAAAVTETIVSTPPKMQSRPSGALRSEGDCIYPSGAGPVSQILINNSYKMADFFRSVIEDTLADLSNNSGALEAKVKVLELEIEKLKHCHQQEITKLKHNSDLVLCEMRKNMDVEKARIINEVRKQCEIERIRSVEEAKKKQWCINCGKEALFYCCWNTSYCDYPCQQQHWATHMNSCTQSQFNLPSTAIASKPTNVVSASKTTVQHMTTPKISTVQTLNLNGRSGLTIQAAQHQQQQQQQQQQQLIITSTRGGAQLGKGPSFQRLR
ncbi:MYND-type zinc finger-containing chromatin reader Zmynd8-like isoform X2 [Wyeomyia smithii]|uniref:MYND-type zinc finger-containing chromatin reader Zmynd8-like isoform X2 n=1 Tax=Wyeomyia smithii TaxID=174621 RepID=UPI002467D1A9|nr:MYND-type zinc finger-containing chromatin reader Zmynd8-like isoform X2 [Wyeomyia smithii]